MNTENSTMYYAKLFLLMIIPIYGFFFTTLIAFSKDVDEELKSLARGALIARIALWVVIGICVMLFCYFIWPILSSYINNIGMPKWFL